MPGATAYTTNLLRAFRGFASINEQQTTFWDEYHAIQMSLNRRSRSGLAFGTNYTLGLSLKGNDGYGNTGLQQRLQHAAGRHHLDPRRSGRVRKAEREPRLAAARHQELCGVGSAERAVALRAPSGE